MGLDQYAFVCDDVDEEGKPVGPVHDIAVWRKHPNLHGWMQRRYAQKSGVDDPMAFNCVKVFLDEMDIDDLEFAVENDELPETQGFFFGQSQPEDKETDRIFIKRARGCLANGKKVYYDSWW